jgi:hypothetical protein
MAKRNLTSEPRAEMIGAVNEMFAKLEQIPVDSALAGSCPELPGVVLERVMASALDRAGDEYKQAGADYEKMRADYLKALTAHPVGRALALLAVGSSGLQMMEQGYVPASIYETTGVPARYLQASQETYNCHHVIPRSLRPADPSIQTNHPSNLVLTNTTRTGRDQSRNPHHFWHSLLLHPQTHNAPNEAIPIYAVRPLFPFYPPITRGFRSVEDLRKNLAALGAAPLPELWEKRILEFSKAARHKEYKVPSEYYEITQLFGYLYKTENKTSGNNEALRSLLAEKSANLAARFLPPGAYLNGKRLPAEHRPSHLLPIIECTSTGQTSVEELIAPKKALCSVRTKKRTAQKAITPKPVQHKI